MTKEIHEWLESICRKCIEANGKCIIDDAYFGLCAEKDRDELLEFIRRERK